MATPEIDFLGKALELTDSVLNKKYLAFLTNSATYKIQEIKIKDRGNALKTQGRVFHLKKFVYDPNENFLQKLTTVVNVAYALNGTILTEIRSNGESVDYYIGIMAKEEKGSSEKARKNREAVLNAFEGTIRGNFNGSEISSCLKGSELEKFESTIDGNAVCTVSVVPSLRDEETGNIQAFVQGIENLVDSLRGKRYTVLTIADPIAPDKISEIRHGYEEMYNYLLPLYKVTETRGTSDSVSISKTDTDSYVQGLTEGISRTQGRSSSTGTTNGVFAGMNAGISLGVNIGINVGFQHSKTRTEGKSDAVTNSQSQSEQTGKSQGKTLGVSRARSDSTQIFRENRAIKSMLDKIEKNLQRIDECEGYGAFHAATYVLADEKETALNVAGNFVSLMKGAHSSAQISGINCWERIEKEYESASGMENKDFKPLLTSLQCFTHPVFALESGIAVSPATMVSGPELTVQLGLPKKSVNGITVLPMHPFGRNIVAKGSRQLACGNLFFMGKEENSPVTLDVDSLSAHTFITGSTGTGKSNVIYGMLRKLMDQKVHFMVVEPAKGEYRNVFGAMSQVRVLGSNPRKNEMLRINPFAFYDDVHVLEHIDRLIEVFNVCWSMYAAMPAILKEAVEDAYRSCGWNLDESENRYDANLFPTFADLEKSLIRVIESSAYDSEVKSNYKGSLLTRVRSLTNGLNGKVFCNGELPEENLFDKNVIVDLSRVGSADTKALIMGILVIRLQEYRMNHSRANSRLNHVTVLEEAHNLLRKTSGEQNMEGSNVLGKSVEMLANAIAEMRTYGEGFIIADQAPGLMDMSVIRNTNTKIILRTPEYTDRVLAGKAAGLDDGQIEELARLPLGVAAVYQNNWLEPVLCKFEKYEYDSRYEYLLPGTVREAPDKKAKLEIIRWMLKHRVRGSESPDFAFVKEHFEGLQIDSQTKLQIGQAIKEQRFEDTIWEKLSFARLAELVVDVAGCGKELSRVLCGLSDEAEMQKQMNVLRSTCLPETIAEPLALEINHCFMVVFSKEGEEARKMYYRWYRYMSGEQR